MRKLTAKMDAIAVGASGWDTQNVPIWEHAQEKIIDLIHKWIEL